MCNFHSICVRVDGVVGHLPTNSHSGVIAALKWRENEPNTKPKFVEVEWDGRGTYPGAENIARVPDGEKLTAAQRKAIDRHYEALAKVLADPKKYARFLTGAGIFSGPEYLDVHIEVARKDACPVLMRLVDGIMGRFAEAATESIRGLLADIIKAPATQEAKIARGFVCADMAIREILPALCDVLKKPDEAKKLRALNRVTDRASAELARQAARSVRDVFRASASAVLLL